MSAPPEAPATPAGDLSEVLAGFYNSPLGEPPSDRAGPPRAWGTHTARLVEALGLTKKTARLLALYEEDLEVRRAPRTVATYLSVLYPFFDWLKSRGLGIHEVKTTDVEAYRSHLYARKKDNGKLYALGTQAGQLLAVRGLFRFLYRRDLSLTDPAAAVELPRQEHRLPRVVLTRREMARLLRGPQGTDPLALRDRALLETLYATGIRASELASLAVGDVDTEERVLRIVRGKGARDRVVPLTRPAAEAIEEYLVQGRPHFASPFHRSWLFLGGYGFKMHRATVALVVRRWARAARIGKHVTPHTFRHTVATHLLQGRADIRHIQSLLGHRSLATTERYTRVEVDDLKKVVERSHPRGR